MRIISLLVVCAVLVWRPSVALSSSIVVRSGEHVGFSRLVFYSHADDLPSLEKSGDRLYIGFSEIEEIELDASSVLEAVSKSRISSVEASGSAIEIVLRCDCVAELSVFGKGIFYLDVFPARQEGFRSVVHSGVLPGGAEIDGSIYTARDGNLPIVFEKQRTPGHPTDSEKAPPLAQEFSQKTTIAKETSANVGQAFRKAVSEAIALGGLEVSALGSSDGLEGRILSGSHPGVEEGGMGFISTRSYTLDATPQYFQECDAELIDSILTFSDVDDLGFSAISSLRSLALNEEFSIQENSAVDLVRFYIASGFGEEARFFLGFVSDGLKKDVLREVVEFLELKGGRYFGSVEGFVPCSKLAKIWSYWAGLNVEMDAQDLNFSVVLFGELPRELRRILETVVLDRYKESGFGKGAAFFGMKSDLEATDLSLGPARRESSAPRSVDFLESRLISSGAGGEIGDVSNSDNRVYLDGVLHSLANDAVASSLREKMIQSFLDDKNWPAALNEAVQFLDASPNEAGIYLRAKFPDGFFSAMGDAELLVMSYAQGFGRVLELMDGKTIDAVAVRQDATIGKISYGPELQGGGSIGDIGANSDSVSSSLVESEPTDIRDPWSEYTDLLESSRELKEEISSNAN